MLVVSVLFYSIGVVIFGVSTSIYIAYFGMFLSGCAGALIIIVLFTLVQTVVDETVRGRVVGVAQMGMQLLGIGYLGGGLIAEIFGLLLAIIIPAILWVLLAILAYLASREFRSF
jgi:MFS family permease